MAATHRSDSSAYVAGCHHSGDRGLGVLGSQIPSMGVHGPAFLYSGLSLPAEAGDEFRILILTVPVGVESLFVQEDSSATADPVPDGVYEGTYEAFKNGVSYGTSTFTIDVGAEPAPAAPTSNIVLGAGGPDGDVYDAPHRARQQRRLRERLREELRAEILAELQAVDASAPALPVVADAAVILQTTPEARPAAPVAESLASAVSDSGDASVAPGLDRRAPVIARQPGSVAAPEVDRSTARIALRSKQQRELEEIIAALLMSGAQ